ncbi:DUF3305 domain-containing protein [Vibrio sp. SCSIO 43136]|uniref:DUF3305 domain-containing protein n=1 Tax=Vibrio sp. SCSIO 43136 TaxID=2819101 RepID=UPI0020761B76|nr:DUF3305 domain-containing protein [Vibrio sp. SCSIO 43136]USD66573.1 DUF3305 domain-containing protein [Vibrio sp. SCSIO 43136]
MIEQESKSDTLWPLACLLTEKQVSQGRWATSQWEWTNVETQPCQTSTLVMPLELYLDERTDYRFNLSSQQPKLFMALEQTDPPKPVQITASQSVAGSFLDGDYLVLSIDMPLPVQAWMEAFIGRNGELLEQRRKKRKGAGRASGQ